METFWSVRANKVMEIVPMEATEKGVERGRERGKESQRLILTMLSASLLACLLKIVFAPLGAIHIRQRGRRKAQGLGKVWRCGGRTGRKGHWHWVGGYLSLFAGRTIHFRVAVLDPSMRHDSFYFGPALTPHLTHDDSAAIRRREEEKR